MRSSDGYRTKQRSLVEEVLIKSGGRHITADEIVSELSEAGVGRTTVYRCLERMVSEGTVQKYQPFDGGSACFQYIGSDSGCSEHFHLKCTGCGKLIHIECEHINELSAHIEAEHGFRVDKLKTVLYGLCEECSKH